MKTDVHCCDSQDLYLSYPLTHNSWGKETTDPNGWVFLKYYLIHIWMNTVSIGRPFDSNKKKYLHIWKFF
jgi:hypothetical protein